MSETAKLIIEDKTYELPVLTGSENEKAIFREGYIYGSIFNPFTWNFNNRIKLF